MKPFALSMACAIILAACDKKIDQDSPGPKTDKTTIELSGAPDATDSFVVNINGSWTITTAPAASWIKLSATSGTGITTVLVQTTEQNTTDNPRSLTLTIAATNNSTESTIITITQAVTALKNWSKLFGGSRWDYYSSVVRSHDGNFIAVGFTESSDGDISLLHGKRDMWIMKLDNFGKIVWQKTFGDEEYEEAIKIVAAPVGYYVLGTVSGIIEATEVAIPQLMKIGEDGEIVWQKTVNLGKDGILRSIQTVSTGGFICSGGDGFDAVLMRFDDSGQTVWSKTYGGTDSDVSACVVEASDGGFIACGRRDYLPLDTIGRFLTQDAWVFKINANGDLLWDKQYGGAKEEWARFVVPTPDGGALVACTSNSDDIPGFHGYNDILLIKVNTDGNLSWQKDYGSAGGVGVNNLVKTNDGDYLLVAGANKADGDVLQAFEGGDAWIVRITSNGDIGWQKTFGGTSIDVANDVVLLDGKLVLAGFSGSTDGDFSSNHGQFDAWMLTTELP